MNPVVLHDLPHLTSPPHKMHGDLGSHSGMRLASLVAACTLPGSCGQTPSDGYKDGAKMGKWVNLDGYRAVHRDG